MRYRKYNEETDFESVAALCHKHKIAMPDKGSTGVVAINDAKEIIGIIAAKKEVFIEPFICPDNKLAANNLFRIMEGILIGSGIESYRLVTTEKFEEEFEKIGFETIETEKLIMEKRF